MFLLVIKGNQQSALQQSHTGRGSNYTLFMFFLARWAEVGGCDEKQEKRKEVFYISRKGGGHQVISQFGTLHWVQLRRSNSDFCFDLWCLRGLGAEFLFVFETSAPFLAFFLVLEK